jgi:hypothetical protein
LRCSPWPPSRFRRLTSGATRRRTARSSRPTSGSRLLSALPALATPAIGSSAAPPPDRSLRPRIPAHQRDGALALAPAMRSTTLSRSHVGAPTRQRTCNGRGWQLQRPRTSGNGRAACSKAQVERCLDAAPNCCRRPGASGSDAHHHRPSIWCRYRRRRPCFRNLNQERGGDGDAPCLLRRPVSGDCAWPSRAV